MSDLLTIDYVTFMPISNFLRLVYRVFAQWIISQASPAPAKRDQVLELVVQSDLRVEKPRLPQKKVIEDMVSYMTPFRRCRHDNKARPSRVMIKRPRLQMVSFEAPVPDVLASQPELILKPQQPHLVCHTVRRRIRRTERMTTLPPSPLPPSFLQ